MLTLILRIVKDSVLWPPVLFAFVIYEVDPSYVTVTYKVDPFYFSMLEMTELQRDWDDFFSRTLHRAKLKTNISPLSISE